MEKEYIALYAGDSEKNGTECGPETKRRCARFIKYALKHPDKEIILLLGAGIRTDIPANPMLKHVMRAHLEFEFRRHGILNVQIVLAKRDAWRTLFETMAIVEELRNFGATQVTVITSWLHMLRVSQIWKLVAPEYQIKKVRSFTLPSIQSLAWELGGWVKLLNESKAFKSRFV